MEPDTLLIADTSPIISLDILHQLRLLTEFFRSVYIPQTVWQELLVNPYQKDLSTISQIFKNNVRAVAHQSELRLILDTGEAEAIQLYQELQANFLLIDDKRAREIAETLDVNCIGTLAILIKAKKVGKIRELRPLFLQLLSNKRYFSKTLLNALLQENGEAQL